MAVKVGSTDITTAYLGSTALTGIYVGAEKVWPTVTCTDVLSEPFNDFTTNGWVLTGVPTIVAGRTGTAASLPSGSTPSISYNLGANEAEYVTFGAAIKFATFPIAQEFLQFRSDAGATSHSVLRLNSSGVVQAFLTGGAQLGANSPALTLNTWYYIEAQFRLHDTLGSIVVRFNGSTVISASGVDTKNGGTKAVVDQIRMQSTGSISPWLIDDLYLSTGAGCTFKGDPSPPLNISNLVGWFDAADTATITASGGAVSQWNDKSGGARHLVQTVAGRRPVTGTRTINGRNVLDWTNHCLRKDSVSLSQPLTVCAVAQSDVPTDHGTMRDICGWSASLTMYHLDERWHIHAGGDIYTGPSSVAAGPHVIVGSYNSTSSKLYLNGTDAGINTDAGTSGFGNICVGNHNDESTQPWDGMIAEIIIYNKVLSTTERQQIESYLKTKWGTP